MRKTLLILALGMFMSATVANACDGDKATKACTKKSAKACKMADAKACKGHDAKACDTKAMKDGKMDCCKSKAAKTATKAPEKAG